MDGAEEAQRDPVRRAVEPRQRRPLRPNRSPHPNPTDRPGRMTMFGVNLKFAGLAIAAALTVAGGSVAAVTSPAHAAEVRAPAAVVATVRYDDLNLRTGAGVDRLNARIRAA